MPANKDFNVMKPSKDCAKHEKDNIDVEDIQIEISQDNSGFGDIGSNEEEAFSTGKKEGGQKESYDLASLDNSNDGGRQAEMQVLAK